MQTWAMILAGRDAGVAFFPGFSDTLGDDEEDGIEEDDEDQGQDNDRISCKYWGPKLKKAVAVMQKWHDQVQLEVRGRPQRLRAGHVEG